MYTTTNYSPNCTSETGMVCRTDNSYYTFYLHVGSTNATIRAGAADAFDSLGATTVLTTTEQSWSGFDPMIDDAMVYGYQLAHPTVGDVVCRVAVSTRVCGAWRVRVDLDALGMTQSQTQHLICHESGHTVGLTHGSGASPWKPESDPDLGCVGSSSTLFLLSHNTAQINATYP